MFQRPSVKPPSLFFLLFACERSGRVASPPCAGYVPSISGRRGKGTRSSSFLFLVAARTGRKWVETSPNLSPVDRNQEQAKGRRPFPLVGGEGIGLRGPRPALPFSFFGPTSHGRERKDERRRKSRSLLSFSLGSRSCRGTVGKKSETKESTFPLSFMAWQSKAEAFFSPPLRRPGRWRRVPIFTGHFFPFLLFLPLRAYPRRGLELAG